MLLFRRLGAAFRRRHVLIIVGLMALVLAVGTIGLHVAQGESYFKSFYWTVVTLATVGYGDIVPTTFWSKMIFFFVVIVGIGTFATALTELAAYMMEQKVLQMRGLHRTRMRKHAIVVGYDESTEELVRQLEQRGLETIIVGKDLDTTPLFAKGLKAITGNPLTAETLERAGITTAEAVILPSADDQSAVMVALKAKQLNPKVHVVATCARRENMDIMHGAKVDVVLPMSRLMGELLAEAVVESKVVDFFLDILEREGGIDLGEIRVERPTTVGALEMRRGEKPIVVYRGHEPLTEFRSDTPLAKGDLVITLYAHPPSPS